MKFSLTLLFFLAASVVRAFPIPTVKDSAALIADTFISDNDIDMASGVYNVILELRVQYPDELVDPDVEELARVQRLHDGRRGWGYSEKREGFHPLL